MTFVTLFPNYDVMHIQKDIGIIPARLAGQGLSVAIACYPKPTLTAAVQESTPYSWAFLDQKSGPLKDGLRYLGHEAKHIDILNVYHMKVQSLIWILAYLRQNPQGKVFWKLDTDVRLLGHRSLHLACGLLRHLCARPNVFCTVESREMQKKIEQTFHFTPAYLPDGLYRTLPRGAAGQHTSGREKVFLTVARLGTVQKNSESLVRAFAAASEKLPDWKLKLVGSATPEFTAWVQDFLARHPALSGRVSFTGAIQNREALESLYCCSRVFVLPSRWESVGLVLMEAESCGCYSIATSAVPAAYEFFDNSRFGQIIPPDDDKALTEAMLAAAGHEPSAEFCAAAEEFMFTHYRWEDSISILRRGLGLEA